jgi:hypothetical protein
MFLDHGGGIVVMLVEVFGSAPSTAPCKCSDAGSFEGRHIGHLWQFGAGRQPAQEGKDNGQPYASWQGTTIEGFFVVAQGHGHGSR